MTNDFFFRVSSLIVKKRKLITREGTFISGCTSRNFDMTTQRTHKGPTTHMLKPMRTLFPLLMACHRQAAMDNI